ncbi:MAG: hypothetical protein AAFR89_08230 [Cyanobacteria bacterium J06633_1]
MSQAQPPLTPYDKVNIVDENGFLIDLSPSSEPETPITGTTLPPGGSGTIGWLSAIYQESVDSNSEPETPITGVTLPPGGSGTIGWLSAIYQNSSTPGTPITGVTLPPGGSGTIGWLSAIYQNSSTPGTPIDATSLKTGGIGTIGWLSQISDEIVQRLSEPVVENPDFTISQNSGTVSTGASSVAIANSGEEPGLVKGKEILPGVTLSWTATWQNVLGEIDYDATGTEFLILEVRP